MLLSLTKQGHDVPLETYLEWCIIVFRVQYICALGLGSARVGRVYSQKPDRILPRKLSATFKHSRRDLPLQTLMPSKPAGGTICFSFHFHVSIKNIN